MPLWPIFRRLPKSTVNFLDKAFLQVLSLAPLGRPRELKTIELTLPISLPIFRRRDIHSFSGQTSC